MIYNYFFDNLFKKMFEYMEDGNDSSSDEIEVEIDKDDMPLRTYIHKLYKEFINGKKVVENEKEIVNGEVTKDSHTCLDNCKSEPKGIDVDSLLQKYQQEKETNHKLREENDKLRKENDRLREDIKCLNYIKCSEDGSFLESSLKKLYRETETMQGVIESLNNLLKK